MSKVNLAVKMDDLDELDFNPLFKALQVRYSLFNELSLSLVALKSHLNIFINRSEKAHESNI